MQQSNDNTNSRSAYKQSHNRCSESSGKVIAVDLGSNSFHLLEASLQQGRLVAHTALAKKVQLGLDMDHNGMTGDAIERGLQCLAEFAPYLQPSQAGVGQRVRLVGTQALRIAANSSDFITAAEDIVGHPIEIISGEQEAALAYVGVVAIMADPAVAQAAPVSLLVADIGGGSTELAAGSGENINILATLPIGCVSLLRHFPNGTINATSMAAAKAAARELIDPFAPQFAGQWQAAVGCSGTLLAVAEVLLQQGWSEQYIDTRGMGRLNQALLSFKHIDAIRFQGLHEDRRSIFASGAAIVSALLESLAVPSMAVSQGGLREGVAWKLLHNLP